MPELTSSEWEEFLTDYPDAHILQTAAWGLLKEHYGWRAIRLVSGDSGAQILFKKVFPGISLAYLPRGPVGGHWETLWRKIDALCREQRAIFLSVEPDIIQGSGDEVLLDQPLPGFHIPQTSIQPRRTILVDISLDENVILERMKQKTRYNIRLAAKRGVVVRKSADLHTFYRLMKVTSQRDQFGVHSFDYYQRAYEIFQNRGECELFQAEYENQIIAALMVFARGSRAWYFYGASSDQYRDYMPTYSLQWEAMRWAKSKGCTVYDLWGVPDYDEKYLEHNFLNHSGGLWGVYRFKRGFGGTCVRMIGPWDKVYNPVIYMVYQQRNRIFARPT